MFYEQEDILSLSLVMIKIIFIRTVTQSRSAMFFHKMHAVYIFNHLL